MRITERTLFILFIYSVVMRCFNVDSGLGMILLGGALSALFYLFFGFAIFNGIGFRSIIKRESYAGISAGRLFGAFGAGIAIAMMAVAATFKFLTLAGDQDLILLAISTNVILLSGIYATLYFKKQKTDAYYKGIVMRAAIALVIGITLSTVDRFDLLKFYYRSDPKHGLEIIDAIKKQER